MTIFLLIIILAINILELLQLRVVIQNLKQANKPAFEETTNSIANFLQSFSDKVERNDK